MERADAFGKNGARTSGVEAAADEGQSCNAAIVDGIRRSVEGETDALAEQSGQTPGAKYRAWTQTVWTSRPSGRRWESIWRWCSLRTDSCSSAAVRSETQDARADVEAHDGEAQDV